MKEEKLIASLLALLWMYFQEEKEIEFYAKKLNMEPKQLSDSLSVLGDNDISILINKMEKVVS